MSEETLRQEGSVAGGLGIGCLLNVLLLCAAGGLATLASGNTRAIAMAAFLAFGIGVSQALVILPAIFVYWRRAEKETVKGLLIVAGITALLNATCWV